MRIIVVTPAVPHPFGDTAGRWFYVLITELLARGHEVVALAATEESQDRVTQAETWLRRHGGRLTLGIHRLNVDRFQLRRKWRSLARPASELIQDHAFVKELHRHMRQGYDVLHLEQWPTGWLGLNVPRALLNVHFFDVLDWAAKKNLSWGERKALWQAQRATRKLLMGIPNVRFLTARLKETAEKIHRGTNYRVVPLALDISLYAMQPLAADPVVGMVGSMFWEPSRSAAERLITRIWPRVKRLVPQAKLLIAGWDAEKYLGKYRGVEGLALQENLPDPRDFFSKAAVMAYAPSSGSGMKVKVMESMAYGVPVVTTWEGVEGIDCENGRHCWVEDDEEKLGARVCRLLQSREEREAMRLAARRLIEQRYSPQPVMDEMIAIYEQLVSAEKESVDAALCI